MPSLRLSIRPFAVLLAAAVAACSSAPTHFYTLLPPASADAAAAAAFAIEVAPVAVPAEVDQTQWLVRTGPGEVAVLDNERWAAPLADELRSAFTDELMRKLGAHDVYNSAKPPGLPIYRIQIKVRRFESVAGQYALIDADWSVVRHDVASAPALECHSRVSQPVEPGYAALAVGHQRATAAIGDDIAQAVRGAVAGRATCPQTGP